MGRTPRRSRGGLLTALPRNKAAERAVGFVRNLTHTEGAWAGQPFNPRPWQEAILRRLFGTLRPDGLRQYRTCYVEVPRKNGKRLALDTPLPTPTGWIKMADVAVGTTLYDERGEPCRVTHVAPIEYETTAYRVEFSDGTEIVADAEHLWLTRAKRKNGGRRGRRRSADNDVRTTEEIRRTLWYDESRRERNHAVVVAGPLRCSSAALPLPPYVLGAWLGDGHSAVARFTCHDRDIQVVDEIRREGVPVNERAGRRGGTAVYLLGTGSKSQAARDVSPQATLRALGVLGNKHIPAAYLRASSAQRLALLQGLMDTDGYCSPAGQCEFTTTSAAIRDDLLELVRSLGMKPSLDVDKATLGGRVIGEKYRIQFWGTAESPVFRLKRKLARLTTRPRGRSGWRQIVAVEPVPSVPMRCIAVDSPSRLYLAGEGMIPTHNTTLAAAIALYMLLGDDEVGAQVYSAAVDREQASLVFNAAEKMVRRDAELAARLDIIPSQRRVVFAETSSFYRAIPADAPSAHGYNASAVIYDELHAAPNRELWDVLTTSMGVRTQPLIFVITTAGFDRHSICWELHAYAEKVRDGVLDDPTFLPVLYGAPDDADWLDEAVWHEANPALGDFRSLEEMRTMAYQAKEVPARQNAFRRLYLNQWTESETRWLDPESWALCGVDRIEPEALRGRRCWLGLDLSSTQDLTACVAIFADDDGGYTVHPHFWVPKDRLTERARRDRVPYDAWSRDGLVEATEGNAVDYGRIFDYVAGLPAALGVDIAELAFDPWNATGLVQRFMDTGLTCVPIRQGFQSLTAPTKELEKLVVSKKLRHGNHPVLRWCAANVVVEQDPAGNLKPSKRKSTERIDGIVALITGLARAMVQPAEAPSVYESRGVLRVQ